jgi:hypothetical protein
VSGASDHMTKARELLNNLTKRDSWVHVELGDDAKYVVKGEGTILFQLESEGSFDAQDVLYVPGLKKNLLLVHAMEDMGFSLTFQRWKVFICQEKFIPDMTVVVGVREGTLYRVSGNLIHALVHDNDNLCEILHRRLGNLHYREFMILRGNVTGLPKFNVE